MKEWDQIYRDLLNAQNMLAEAIASADTLNRRDRRAFEEIKDESDAWRQRALAAEDALRKTRKNTSDEQQ